MELRGDPRLGDRAAAADGARRRRGQQLRRRGQAVPGRCSIPKRLQAAGSRSRRSSRRSQQQRQRRRRLHRAQPRALRHRHRRPGQEPRRPRARRRSARRQQGVPITIATVGDVQFGPRLRRGAAPKDGEGEVVIGVALMLIGENSRTRDRGGQGEARGDRSRRCPRARASSRSTTAATLVDRTIRTVAHEPARGRAARHRRAASLLLGDLRAGLVVAMTIPLVDAVRGHRDERDSASPAT